MSEQSYLFTQEELALLAAKAEVQIVGFDWPLLKDLSQREVQLVMRTADHSLRARGYVFEDGSVAGDLVDLLSQASQADHTFILTEQHNTGFARMALMHVGVDGAMLHVRTAPALEYLEWDQDLSPLLRLIGEMLEDAEGSQTPLEGIVAPSVIYEARESARQEGYEAAANVLREARMDREAADSFAVALTTPFVNIGISRVGNNIPTSEEIAILTATNGIWLMQPSDEAEGVYFIHVSRVDAESCISQVRDWLEEESG